ncbi:MAG: hypothetical protein MRJ68_19625 [Nitrospira sp.]|nr:hypothetical protein [Nitrospira sp.]
MRLCSHQYWSFLAVTVVVFMLAFSFNAYACVLPLSGTNEASMANGCSTPIEQPARQMCDAFTTLGVEPHSQSSSILLDHHWPADRGLAALPVLNHQFERLYSPDQPFESSSPPHPSLASTVLRI